MNTPLWKVDRFNNGRVPSKGPVVLVPGVGTGSAVFMPPNQITLPQFLRDAGYDVWLLDWRPNGVKPWTVEEVAAADVPEAMTFVASATNRPVKVIAHCIGAMAVMLASVRGLLPAVTTIIANAVSLHPCIPRTSYLRMRALLPVSKAFPLFLDPQWGPLTRGWWPTLFRLSARYGLRGCPNETCKLIRWLYGEVWNHGQVSESNHRWLIRQFHQVPVSFFQQLGPCIRQGQMAGLPSPLPEVVTRCVFLSGLLNRCFLPASQIRSYIWMQEHSCRKDHSLRLFPDYGHLDVFVGKRAFQDTYPTILEELSL